MMLPQNIYAQRFGGQQPMAGQPIMAPGQRPLPRPMGPAPAPMQPAPNRFAMQPGMMSAMPPMAGQFPIQPQSQPNLMQPPQNAYRQRLMQSF